MAAATWVGLDNAGYGGFLWSAEVARDRRVVLVGTTGYNPPSLQYNFLRSTDGNYFSGVVVSGVLVPWDIECQPGGICNSPAKNTLYRSADYGASWSRMSISAALAGRFYGLNCTGANTCWMVGKRIDDWADPFNPMIYTTNGGASWTRANVAGMPTRGMLWDVQMVDNQHGYVVGCNDVTATGEDCQGQGLMYQTADGHNWTAIPAPAIGGVAPGLTDLQVFALDDVFVLDWNGNIWHGSNSPEPITTPTQTAIPALTPTKTPTKISTEMPTSTPTQTPTRTHTPTVTPTRTQTPTVTPTDPYTDCDADADPNSDCDADADPNSDCDADADPNTDYDADADPNTDCDADADPNTDCDADTNPNTDYDADADPNTDCDADADRDDHGHGDGNGDGDINADRNADRNASDA